MRMSLKSHMDAPAPNEAKELDIGG